MHIPQTEVILRHEGRELARLTLPPGEYVIGRSHEADIHANTPLISRQHARLTINYDHLLLEDLRSSNGSFVNEKPITEATRLFPNQSIRLGNVALDIHRQRAPSGVPGVSLVPVQAAIRRILPDELLAHKRYAIGGIVARGGMGAILDARQNAIERTVAMKVMLDAGDESRVLRFIDEAKITGQLEHPNIVPVHELGVDEQDQLFYTMKMVHGITLKKVLDLLAQGVPETVKKYPLPALLTIFQKVCDGLAFAHSKGVIHRDLKPENIMLGNFGSVLVMDWGLAKVIGKKDKPAAEITRSLVLSARGAEPNLGSTLEGSIMGTPQYMSPEQARGEVETLDARTDIYPLGAILFEMLHLRPTVTGANAMDIVRRVERGEIAWDSKKNARIPDSLLAVCRKALALDPAARYRSVEELQRDVAAYQGGFATGAEHAGFFKQITLLVKRNMALFNIAFAAWFIITALAGWFVLKVTQERNRAERALADLRSTGPTLIGEAQRLIDEQKFDEALVKIDFAVRIDGNNPDYHLLRGQVLEATLKLKDALEEFRQVLALGPNDSAAANFAVCAKLLAGGQIDASGLTALHELMLKEGRTTQDVPIVAILGLGRAASDTRLKALFEEWRKLPGWEKMAETARFRYETNGTLTLDLSSLPVSDLSALHGLPIASLTIGSTKVEDLRPLAGFRLTSFSADSTPISDLSPLRGMPLAYIRLSHTNVEDLSPLAGMPLKSCQFVQMQVMDFTPLKHCPIRDLSVDDTRLTTLEVFAGMPCERISALRARALVDISAVRSMRLKHVFFEGCTGVGDVTPLADCPDLEEVSLPREAKNADALRRLSKLRRIKYGADEACSPEELWVKLGLGNSRDREDIALIQKARTAVAACGGAKTDPGWVKVLADGTLDLMLNRVECKTLEPLRGLPVSVLDIGKSSITDLSPAAEMPLRKLLMDKTRISNLSPLAKCRELQYLACPETDVRDLSPLAGLPLAYFDGSLDNFSSLAPLGGMPLTDLRIRGTPVSDLRPLLSCPALEWLTIPSGAKDAGQLRALTKLVRLSERWDPNLESPSGAGGPALTAEEFWKEYDAKHGGAAK